MTIKDQRPRSKGEVWIFFNIDLRKQSVKKLHCTAATSNSVARSEDGTGKETLSTLDTRNYCPGSSREQSDSKAKV